MVLLKREDKKKKKVLCMIKQCERGGAQMLAPLKMETFEFYQQATNDGVNKII